MKILDALDVTGNPIRNVPTPSAGTDGANKAYVDSKAGGTGPSGYVASYINTSVSTNYPGSSTTTGYQIVNAGVSAGRYYLITVMFSYSMAAGLFNTYHINDGTDSKQVASTANASAVAQSVCYGSLLYTPTTSGLKTIRLDITRVSGTGNLQVIAQANYPLQIVLIDIGGSSPDSGRGLVASHILTTSQTGTGTPITDALTVSFTPVAGATYRACLLSPFSKTSISQWDTRFMFGSVAYYGAAIPNASSGSFTGAVVYVPSGAAPVTLTVVHDWISGGAQDLTLPGSATTPRQLWVERIA